MSLRDEFRAFLDRPDGGMEVEIICGCMEFVLAIGMLWSARTVESIPALGWLYWSAPHYVIAIPWLISSLATISGLVLYWKGNHGCIRLRSAGAYISGWMWFGMFILQLSLGSEGSLLTTSWAFFAALWQPRIVISANKRRRLRLDHG